MTDAQLEVPTRVGVYRPRVPTSPRPTRSPHTRGGVPWIERLIWTVFEKSPHAWGCTGAAAARADGGHEVPTRVGVYRGSNA